MSSISFSQPHQVFLLNPDGSAPPTIDIATLQAAGVRVMVPTPVPRAPGLVAIEQEPTPRADGLWQQVWELQAAPPEYIIEPEANPQTVDQALQSLYQTLGLDTQEKQAAFRSLLASGSN